MKRLIGFFGSILYGVGVTLMAYGYGWPTHIDDTIREPVTPIWN